MTSRVSRRLLMAALFVAGPLAGALLNGDRGILLGGVTSVIAVVWFLLDERKVF